MIFFHSLNSNRIIGSTFLWNDVAKTQSYINKVNRSTSEPLSTVEQKELFEVAEKVTAKELELALVNKHNEIERHKAEATGGTVPEPSKVYRRIVVEAEPEVIEVIEELKSLLSHKVIDGSLNQILKEALPLAIRELKIKKGLATRTTPLKPSTETSSMMAQEVKSPDIVKIVKTVSRSILNGIKRLVWVRDQGRCQFRDPVTNKICGSTFQVEFDHIRPWSFNGEHSVENITSSCKSHNLYRWQSVEHMNFNTKAKQNAKH